LTWRRACRGVALRRRHGCLTDDEVFLDAEMRWKMEPEKGDLGRLAGMRGWPVVEDL
jgi:hypothetical protein